MDQLKDYRKEIDDINKDMIKLFIRRMKLSEKIGEYKHNNNLPIRHEGREQEIIEGLTENIEEKYREYTKVFLEKLIQQSRDIQGENQKNG